MHDTVGADRLIDMVRKGDVFGVGEVFDMEIFLCFFDTGGSQNDGMRLFVDDIITVKIVIFLFVVQLFYLAHTQRTGKFIDGDIQFV